MVIATIAGVTITLPGLLSGAWFALKFAHELYGQVDLQRTQLKLILDRCSDLLLRVAQSLPASEVDVSAQMRENIDHLQATCQSLWDVIDKLKRKGFLWCMTNQDKIDTQIFDVQSRIADTFALFNFSAHISIEEFHQRLLQARDQDQSQLITKLDSLSENDQQILNALKYQDGAQKRVEELLVGVLRCVQNLGTEQSPQARFLRNASAVLQRASKGHIPDISADYVITSLEVDFQDTDSIGQGAFGRVFKGEWNGSRVAIKQMHIDNARILSEDDRKSMYREVRQWTRLHHPHILNLYGACLEATSPFLVMQYCPFGNMCHYLVEHPETNRVDISYDIVAGMIYLHNKGIVHADLKGANILIYKGIALVADFGLSAVIDGIQSRSALSSMATSVRGTPQWMAPEVHKGEPPRKASDVYSLGLTMWEAFSGEIPYQDVNRYGLSYVIAVENRRPERPARLTENAVWDIIQECWAPVAARRPSVQKVQGKLSPYTTRLNSFVGTQSPAPRLRSPTQQTVIRTPPVNMQPSETTSSVLEKEPQVAIDVSLPTSPPTNETLTETLSPQPRVASSEYLAQQPATSASPNVPPHVMPVPQPPRRAAHPRKKPSQKQAPPTKAEAIASSPEKPTESHSAPVPLPGDVEPEVRATDPDADDVHLSDLTDKNLELTEQASSVTVPPILIPKEESAPAPPRPASPPLEPQPDSLHNPGVDPSPTQVLDIAKLIVPSISTASRLTQEETVFEEVAIPHASNDEALVSAEEEEVEDDTDLGRGIAEHVAEMGGDLQRRVTMAERMVKFGGVKFGSPRINRVQPFGPTQPAEDAGTEGSAAGSGQAVPEEEENEEDEQARRKRIAAKIAGMGGMRVGMLPIQRGIAPVPTPPRQPAAHYHESEQEYEQPSISDDGVQVEAEGELKEDLEDEYDNGAVEGETPVVPPPPLPPPRSRPPVPPTLLPGRSRSTSTIMPASRPPVRQSASEFVMIESEETPFPAPTRHSRVPSHQWSVHSPQESSDLAGSSQWKLPSIPSGRWPRTPVLVPSHITSDELRALWERVGVYVGEAASQLLERSKRTLVGNGSYEGFVAEALALVPNALPPQSPGKYGILIYAQTAAQVHTRVTDILPGDIVVLDAAKLKGYKGLRMYITSAGEGAPCMGVVTEFDVKKLKLKALQGNQRVGQETVESVSYRLEDLKGGTIKVYRVREA